MRGQGRPRRQPGGSRGRSTATERSAGRRKAGRRRGAGSGSPIWRAFWPLIGGVGLVLLLALLGQWVTSRLPDGVLEPGSGTAVDAAGAAGASPGVAPEPSVGGKAASPANLPAPVASSPPQEAGTETAAGAAAPAGTAAAQPAEAPGNPDAGPAQASAGTGPGTGPGGNGTASLPGTGPVANEVATGRQRLDRSGGVRPAVVVTAYFVDTLSPDTVLQPVEVLVPHSMTPLRTLVELLLAPPEHLHLTSGIPPGTRLYREGLNLQPDGSLVVDLTAELYHGSGSAWANAVTHTLVYTLTEHPGVNAVLLRVEGEPAELEGRVWDRPLTRQELAERQLYRVEPVIRFEGL